MFFDSLANAGSKLMDSLQSLYRKQKYIARKLPIMLAHYLSGNLDRYVTHNIPNMAQYKRKRYML